MSDEQGQGDEHQVRDMAGAVYSVTNTSYPMQNNITTEPHSQITRIAARNGGYLEPVTTSDRGRELARKRWDGMSKAARLGIADAGAQIPEVSRRAPLKVVRYLVEQHTLNAADPSAAGSVQSLREVVKMAYPAPERGSGGDAPPADGLSLHLGPDLARELLQRLRGGG